MKKILAILAFCSFAISQISAQCNSFYPIKQGRIWELENYSGKNKFTGKTTQEVTNFSENGNGFDATVHTKIFNDKGKEISKADLQLICNNGTILIDMRNYISQEQIKTFSSVQTKIETENLEFPDKLEIGQTLKDGSITISTIDSSLPMKMTVTISDRKVTGKESITTPAGTFDCYKISNKITLQNQMGINMTIKMTSTDWISKNVGMVKTETYNNKDVMTAYTILTKTN
jgi:hypothetical protein